MRLRTMVLCAPLALASCIYIHDAQRQKIAEDTKSGFEAIAGATPNGDALQKFKDHREAVEALTNELHTAREQVELNALLEMKWADIQKATTDELTSTNTATETEKASIEAVKTKLQARLAALPGITKNVTSLADAMTEASRKGAGHAATQELLQQALVAVVDGKPSSFDDLRKALSHTETFTQFTVSGDDITETKKTATIGDLVGIPIDKLPAHAPTSAAELKEWSTSLAAIAKLNSAGEFDLRDPGIATTVIGLGLDIALAEQQRARAEIATARRELAAHKVLLNDLADRARLLKGNASNIDKLINPGHVSPTETLRESFERLSAAYKAANDAMKKAGGAGSDQNATARGRLAGAYIVVADNYRGRVLADRTIEMQRDRILSLDAERALAVAAVNLSEREAVIGRGMEGLVAFHQGGLNDNDVKSIIGVAQAAGLFAIGGL
jgi:hypothetical protein